MKAKEIREMKDIELEKKLADLKEEYFNLRFQKATGQLTNGAKLKDVKRDIARVKTVIREREIESGAC